MDSGDYWAGYEDKPTVWLDDWSIVPDREPDPYQAPELIRPRLHGRVNGHPHHNDGEYVTTSPLLASAGRVVETHNTVYNLGLMSSGYKEWCSSQGIDVDPKRPVKVSGA
jgi:hypothetical protein